MNLLQTLVFHLFLFFFIIINVVWECYGVICTFIMHSFCLDSTNTIWSFIRRWKMLQNSHVVSWNIISTPNQNWINSHEACSSHGPLDGLWSWSKRVHKLIRLAHVVDHRFKLLKIIHRLVMGWCMLPCFVFWEEEATPRILIIVRHDKMVLNVWNINNEKCDSSSLSNCNV